MSLVTQNLVRTFLISHRYPDTQLLSSTVLDVKEHCKEIERTVTVIGDKLGTVTTTLDVIKDKCDDLEVRSTASMRAFEAKVDTIYRKIESFEKVVDSAYNKVSSFEKRMDAMISKFEALETQIGKFDKDLDAIFDFVGDYREKTNAEIAMLKGLPA